MPQADISTFLSQIFWLFVSFGVMYSAFSFYIIPKISAIAFQRSKEIRSNQAHADMSMNQIHLLESEIVDLKTGLRAKIKDEDDAMRDEIRAFKKTAMLELDDKIHEITDSKMHEFLILLSSRESMAKNMLPELVFKIYEKVLTSRGSTISNEEIKKIEDFASQERFDLNLESISENIKSSSVN